MAKCVCGAGRARRTHAPAQPPRARRTRKSDGQLPLLLGQDRRAREKTKGKSNLAIENARTPNSIKIKGCKPTTESKQMNSRVWHLD